MTSRAYGLKVVWPPPEKSVSEGPALDILAIHGLDTHSPHTWEAWETEGDQHSRTVNWLSDDNMLPNVVKNARIMTYDYDAGYHHDAPLSTIESQADSLLKLLSFDRKKNHAEDRPLLFIASCFGGLVLIKAMNLASVNTSQHQSILSAVKGIIFLGTPLRGTPAARLTRWKTYVSTIMGEITSNTLIRDLEQNNPQIEEMVQSFTVLANEYCIPLHCFYESKKTPILKKGLLSPVSQIMIVDKYSATLDSAHQTEICVKHSSMNKFRGPLDANFQLVAMVISRFAENTRVRSVAQQKDDSWFTDCKRELYDVAPHYENQKEEVHQWAPGTCQWITHHQKFRDWIKPESSSLLWVTGNPGCGKTVLTKFLNQQLVQSQSFFVCPFFFKRGLLDQEKAHQALSSFLHRLISQSTESTPHRLHDEYKSKGKLLFQDVKAMWSLLLETSKKLGPTLLLIDALDECDDESEKIFMECLVSTFSEPNLGTSSARQLKVLVTSRPENDIQRTFRPFQELRIRREDQTNEIRQDIQIVINNEINGLKELGAEICQYLNAALQHRISDGSFLLVHIIFEKLRTLKLTNMRTVRSIVEGSGQDLDAQYDQVLKKSKNPALTARLFEIIVAAKRALTVDEINIALNIEPGCRKFDDIDLFQGDVEAAVKAIGGFMVRMSKGRVYLVHETARAYLLQNLHSQEQSLYNFRNANQQCHDAMYKRCILYLGLEDWPPVKVNLQLEDLYKNPGINTLFHQILRSMSLWIQELRFKANMKPGAFDLLEFACLYWQHHFQESEMFPSENTRKNPSILSIACLFGRADLVRLLLPLGHQAHRTRQVFTSLLAAVISGNTETVEILFKYVIDTREGESIGFRHPLYRQQNGSRDHQWFSLQFESLALMQLCQGCWPNFESIESSLSSIMLSYQDMIDLLRHNTHEAHHETRKLRLDLILAAMGNAALVPFSFHPDQLASNDTAFNCTATNLLAMAALNDVDWICQELINQNVSLIDCQYFPQLFRYAIRHRNIKFLKGLHRSGIRLTVPVDNNQSALHWCAISEERDILIWLLANMDDYNEPDSNGRTALHVASRHGHLKIVEELLKRRERCNLDSVDTSQQTPLLDAIHNRHFHVARCLIAGGASVYCVPGTSSSALHAILYAYHLPAARQLLDYNILSTYRYQEESMKNIGKALVQAAVSSSTPMNILIAAIAHNFSKNSSREGFYHEIKSNPELLLAMQSSRRLPFGHWDPETIPLEALSHESFTFIIWFHVRRERTISGGNMLHWAIQCVKKLASDQTKVSVYGVVDTLIDGHVQLNATDDQARTPIALCQELRESEESQALIDIWQAVMSLMSGDEIRGEDSDMKSESHVFGDASELISESESNFEIVSEGDQDSEWEAIRESDRDFEPFVDLGTQDNDCSRNDSDDSNDSGRRVMA